MRAIVCGGRAFRNRALLYAELDKEHSFCPIDLVIQGGAAGADHLAMEWAHSRGVPCETYQADWEKHGKAAGPLRNQRMLVEGKAHIVLAFPGGRGTGDMIRRARAAGIQIKWLGVVTVAK